MSHVDEGTLHAYLDGELPSSERAAVDAHLAQCATCAAMRAEERALLERASALLGTARPVERPAPPFEQLRRSPKRSPWHVRTPFAWAASLALALGLGYSLRGSGSDVAPNTPAYHRAPRPVATAVEARRESRQARRRQQEPQTTDVVANAEARADSAAVGALALKSSTELRNATPAPAAPASALPDSLVLLQGVVVTGASPVAALRGQAGTTQWQIISRGTARTLLGTEPVGLPGLATRQIRRSPAPDGTVVVEQALDSSTVIEIYQRPADGGYRYRLDGAPLRQAARDRAARDEASGAPAPAPAPAPAAAAPVSADRLARYVGRLRVEIAGPLSPDSLNRLLEQVEPLP